MNELMTREEFLKERNAVCESDAVAGVDDVCKGQNADTAVMTEENGKLSADGINKVYPFSFPKYVSFAKNAYRYICRNDPLRKISVGCL